MWGIIGLGNPGSDYDDTKHNVGFEVVMRLARAHGVRVRRARAPALAGVGEIEGQPVVLAMPTTMMNLSGAAVARLCHMHELEPDHLIIIVDDINLNWAACACDEKAPTAGIRVSAPSPNDSILVSTPACASASAARPRVWTPATGCCPHSPVASVKLLTRPSHSLPRLSNVLCARASKRR